MGEGYGHIKFEWRPFQARGTATASTSDVELKAAPGLSETGAKLCYFISKVSCSNLDDLLGSEAHLKSGPNGSSTTFWTFNVPFDGGNEAIFPHPIKCSGNEALQFAAGTSVSSLTLSVSGYIGLDFSLTPP
jgi:hypothetical protein